MSIYPAFPFVPVVSILKRKGEKRRYAPFGMIEPKFGKTQYPLGLERSFTK
jgi:hypothetical protein